MTRVHQSDRNAKLIAADRSRTTPLAVFALAASVVGSTAASAGSPGTPQFYSGYYEVDGAPVSGLATVTLNVWRNDFDTDPADQVCSTTEVDLPVAIGKFSLLLSNACAQMGAEDQLHLEVVIDGNPMPRTRVGQLPYANAATSAENAAGLLATRLEDVESAAFNALTAFDLNDTPQTLNAGTTIDGVTIQRAIPVGFECTPGDVMSSLDSDGFPVCVPLPAPSPDVTATAVDLNPGTTIGTDEVQRALNGACSPGDVVNNFDRDGNVFCSPLPPDVTVSGADLNPGTTIGTDEIQRALNGACSPGDVVNNFDRDGNIFCSPLPPDVTVPGADLNPATTIGTDEIQRALNGACSPGDVVNNFDRDGNVFCSPLPPDVTVPGADLNPATTIGTDEVQRALNGACSPGDVIDNFDRDGNVSCLPLPPDVTAGAFDLDALTTVGLVEIQRALIAPCPGGEFLTGIQLDGTAECSAPSGPRTLTVGAGHAHFVDVGSAVAFAVTNLAPVASDPVIIEVEPGTYAGFTGANDVLIIGSGVGVTIFNTTGTAVSLPGGALTNATIEVVGTSPSTGVNVSGSSALNDVFIDVNPAGGAAACNGIIVSGAAVDLSLHDVGISVLSAGCGGGTMGIELLSSTVLNAQRLEVFSTDQILRTNGGDARCSDCKLVADASVTTAIELGSGNATFVRSEIEVSGSSAIAIDVQAAFVVLESTTVRALASGSSPIEAITSLGFIRIVRSRLEALGTGLEYDVVAVAEIWWSQISGSPTDGPFQVCASSFDDTGLSYCG